MHEGEHGDRLCTDCYRGAEEGSVERQERVLQNRFNSAIEKEVSKWPSVDTLPKLEKLKSAWIFSKAASQTSILNEIAQTPGEH